MELLVGSPRSDAELGGAGAGMKSLVPDGDDQIGVGDGEGAREVHGVGASERVKACQPARVAFDGGGEFDTTRRGPVFLPGLLGGLEVIVVEDVVAGGRSKSGAYFGVGEPARDHRVTAVPKPSGHIASNLFDHKLHESARVEVDQRHRFSVAVR
jgi:hypothetical protein